MRWRSLIGADWLIYQDLDDLIAACKHEDARIEEFDTSCFSGEYVTGDVTPEYLERLQLERSDAAKARAPRAPCQAQSRPRELSLADASDPRRALLLELLQAGLRARGRTPLRARTRSPASSPMLARPSGWPRRQGGSLAMARGAHEALGSAIERTLLITRDAQSAALPRRARGRARSLIGAHPLPDERSLAAGARLLAWVETLPPQAQPLFLISGGASSSGGGAARGSDAAGPAGAHPRRHWRRTSPSGSSTRAASASRASRAAGSPRASRGRAGAGAVHLRCARTTIRPSSAPASWGLPASGADRIERRVVASSRCTRWRRWRRARASSA